jgi:membrane-associated HD superfamily phosphohydrolase
MKMVEEIEDKTLAAMLKARDEKVAQLSGEEKILALRDIALQKIHEEKMALEDSVQTQIEKLQAMEQTQEVLDTIANLEFVHEDEMARLKEERRNIIKEAFDEQQALILETGELEIEKNSEVTEKQLENDNRLKKSAREVFREYMMGADMVVEGLNVAADLIDQNAMKNKKNAELVFNIRKAAAIAEIAIATAKNIVEVAPLGPIAMLAMAGIGTAQAALVASEQPKFHMGGMIGGGGTLAPDETMVTAKRGEAILSTAAVNRIGEDGVRSLETGGGITPKIIVMNPFKHYDRFIRGRDAMGMSAIQGTGRKGY